MNTAMGLGLQLGFAPGGALARPFYGQDFDGGDYDTNTGMAAILGAQTTGALAFWAKADDGVQNTVVDVTNGGAIRTDIAVQFLAGKFFINCSVDGTVQWRWQSTSTVAVNTWHHYAIAQNGTTPSIYEDGVAMAGSFVITTDKTIWFKGICVDATNDADRIVIGADYLNSAYGEFFTKSVTQVVFSSAVWTAAIALARMSATTVPDADLLYYRMGSPDNGATVTDEAGNLDVAAGAGAAAPTWWTTAEIRLPPENN